MEIDIEQEKVYLFSQVARMGVFPNPTSYKTVHRYARTGRVNLSGVTVFLQFVRTPSGFATSTEAVKRFLETLNE